MSGQLTRAFVLSLFPTLSLSVAHADEASDKAAAAAKLAEINALAAPLQIEFKKLSGEAFKLTLPKDISLNGYNAKEEQGQNVITFNEDPRYIRCLSNAERDGRLIVTSSVVSGLAGGMTGGLPGMALGASEGYAVGNYAARRQEGYSAQDCIADAGDRMTDALGDLADSRKLDRALVKIDGVEKKLTGVSGEYADLRTSMSTMEVRLRNDLRKSLKAQIDKVATKQDVDKIVAFKMDEVKEKTRKYFEELKTAQQDAAKQREMAQKAMQLKADIQLTEQGLTSMVGIVFGDNPKLANKINRSISGVAQLTQIGVTLAGATVNPFQAVMLSMSAMGVMNSMLGGGSNSQISYDQLILGNIQSLQRDISSLRSEMHTRFDTIQKSIATLASYMENRFSNIDSKLDTIRTELGDLQAQTDIRERLDASSLTYLLNWPYRRSYQICLEPGNAAHALDYQKFGECLADFKLYSTDVARLDMIAGGGRVDKSDPLGRVSTKMSFSIDSEQMLGYLAAFDRAVANEGASQETPSPREWVRGAEAFVEMLERSDSLPRVKAEAAKSIILEREQTNLARIIEAGEQIKSTAQKVRREGAVIALSLYKSEMKKLSDKMLETLASDLSKRSLDITQEAKSRENKVGYLATDRLQGCAVISRDVILNQDGIPADKVTFEQGRLCTHEYQSNAEYMQNTIINAQNATIGLQESAFAFQTLVNKVDAVQQLQRSYLERQITSKYPEQVKAFMSFSMNAFIDSKDAASQLARVEYLKQLLLRHVMIGLDNSADLQTREDIRLVDSLPTTPAQVKTLLAGADFKSDKPLKEAFATEVGRIIAQEETRISEQLKSNHPNKDFPFVDRVLSQLRSLQLQ